MLGIHQNDQGRRLSSSPIADAPPANSQVRIVNITYRRIEAEALYGGEFKCNQAALRCEGIRLEHVHLNLSRSGCVYENTAGSNDDVSPGSCAVPPEFQTD